jgi:hypothetical protein
MLAGVPTGATPIVPELPFIRTRGEGEQRATFFELFFDLVYVFAVTQLSHHLLADISWSGAAESAFMLVALYWVWNYTTWMTNWFDPDTVPVRLVLVFVMLASLLLAVAIPDGFGGHALLFACAYAGLQIGRNTFVVAVTPRGEFNQNFRQILAWSVLSAPLWVRAASSMPNVAARFRVPLGPERPRPRAPRRTSSRSANRIVRLPRSPVPIREGFGTRGTLSIPQLTYFAFRRMNGSFERRASHPEVALEIGTHLRAPAMEQHALIAVAELERVTDLVRRPALDVAQCQHRTLHWGQRRDRVEDQLPGLHGEQVVLGRIPAPWRGRPMAGRVPLVGPQEAIRIDHWPAVRRLFAAERGERNRPTLTCRAGLGRVGEDPENPRPQRRATLEAAHSAQNADPGLLEHILRRSAAADVAHRDAQQRGTVLVDQAPERFLVSVPQGVEQLGVVHAGSVERCARRAESPRRNPAPAHAPSAAGIETDHLDGRRRRYIAIVV